MSWDHEALERLGQDVQRGLEAIGLPAGVEPPEGYVALTSDEAARLGLNSQDRSAPSQGGYMPQVPRPALEASASAATDGGPQVQSKKTRGQKGSDVPPSAPSYDKSGSGNVHVDVRTGRGGSLVAGALAMALVLAGTAAYVEKGKIGKWLSSGSSHSTAQAGPNQSSALASSSPSSPDSSASPSASLSSESGSSTLDTSPSATPFSGPIPVYKPTDIPPTEAVTGTITNLQLPITENYTRPGDKTKKIFKLNNVFAEAANGTFTITFQAGGGKGKALTYDEAQSNGTGVSIANFDGSKMTLQLNLSGVTTQPMIQGSNNRVLAATMNKNFTPAITVNQTDADKETAKVLGNPQAKDAAIQLGQTKEFDAAVRNTIATLILSKYAGQLATILKPYISADMLQQQLSQKIPKANVADPNEGNRINLTKLPDMSSAYPAPTDPAFTSHPELVVLSNGTPAKGNAKATPATIVLQSMKKTG